MKKKSLVIISILIMAIFFTPRFHIYQGEVKNIIFSSFLFPGERFTLKYIHSVQKTPVYEIYHLDFLGRIVMDETGFKSYGAGLPLARENFSREDDYFVLKKMEIFLPKLIIRVARTPGQIVTIRGKEYILKELADPGERIGIYATSFCSKMINFINKMRTK